jgi:hypothetical protein
MTPMTPMTPIAIIDFETTGISPNMGDRAPGRASDARGGPL